MKKEDEDNLGAMAKKLVSYTSKDMLIKQERREAFRKAGDEIRKMKEKYDLE